jgi:hypothetical protein
VPLGVPPALFWAPRVICLGYAVFISVFALDALGGGKTLAANAAALLLHLLPTLAVVLLLAVAWRRELVGAVAFPVLGILYISWAWGRFPWFVSLIVAGPVFLVGGLFLANSVVRSRASSTSAGRSAG